MGLGTTWIASRGLGADRMLDALGLVATGEFEGAYVADAAIAEIPGGWCVVHFGRFDPRPEWVARSFPNGEVIWGASSETVMWSGAYGLSDGRLVWSAEHDPEKDREGVSTSGALPDAFGEVMDGLQRQQEGDGEEDVDHLFEVPMALTAALCGYDPTRQAAGVPFRVVEPLRSGAAGERQAARIALTRALADVIQTGLMPIAQGLGFLSPEQISDSPYKFNSPYTMVRFRDGWSEVLDFAPDVSGRHPRIGITFFVRRGLEPRGGSYGVAIAPQPKRSFLELFSRRKEPTAEEAVAQAAAEAGELLHIVDRHLKDGTSHPRLRPAVYYDEPAR